MPDLNKKEIEEGVIQRTIHQIQQNSRVNEKVDSARSLIYNLLTQRIVVQEKIHKNPDFLFDVQQQIPQYFQKYRELLEKNEKQFPTSQNPAWTQFNCCKIFEKTDVNFKFYKTLDPFDLKFLLHLWELFDDFQRLWMETKSNISFKIPTTFSGFYAWSDNLVVHFSDSKNIAKIEKILENWMQKNKISKMDRDFDRTELAADHSDTSFSNYIATYYTQKWLEWYSSNNVVRGAIEASKKPNFRIK